MIGKENNSKNESYQRLVPNKKILDSEENDKFTCKKFTKIEKYAISIRKLKKGTICAPSRFGTILTDLGAQIWHYTVFNFGLDKSLFNIIYCKNYIVKQYITY